VVVDMDNSVREANFYSLSGKSSSHSLQFQTDYQLMRRLDLRLAYRFLNVQTDYLKGTLSRPLVSKHRAFLNLAYETKLRWKFDYTVQWTGQQRIPDTGANPVEYRTERYSPHFVTMNAQITKDIKENWSLYLGVENITDYKVASPILAADQPFSEYFDSSLVWGPVFGRMAYAGFRYRIK
jgi:outer membrane receptor protein involved in Fe transport